MMHKMDSGPFHLPSCIGVGCGGCKSPYNPKKADSHCSIVTCAVLTPKATSIRSRIESHVPVGAELQGPKLLYNRPVHSYHPDTIHQTGLRRVIPQSWIMALKRTPPQEMLSVVKMEGESSKQGRHGEKR